jgi:dihydrofolate reductase
MAKKRNIILFIATSLDGYIARKDGGIDWLFTDQDYGYEQFYSRIDTVIMGRKTYEDVLTFGEFPYKGKECYVFSKTNQKNNPYVEFIHEDVLEFITKLIQQEGKDIWLVGGAGLIESFIRHNLIDEFIISIHPILLGDGIPLFLQNEYETKLTIKNCNVFDTGLVQLHYVK